MSRCFAVCVQRATFLPGWRHSFLQNPPAGSSEPFPTLRFLPNLVSPLSPSRVRPVSAAEKKAETKTREKKSQKKKTKGRDAALGFETGPDVLQIELRAGPQHETLRAETGFKLCCECGYSKPLVDFERSKASLDGRSAGCRACIASLRARRSGRPLYHLGMSVKEAWENAKVCTMCKHLKELRDFTRLGEGTAGRCRGCQSKFLKPVRAPADTPQPCNECGEVKPAIEFHIKRHRQNGLSGNCKSCCAKIEKARREAYRESNVVLFRAYKMCTMCKRDLPRKEFYGARTLDGLQANCKTCFQERTRKLREQREQGGPPRDAAEQSG